MFILNYFNRLNKKFLSEETKSRSERIILKIAIASFVLHLAIIFLVDLVLVCHIFYLCIFFIRLNIRKQYK